MRKPIIAGNWKMFKTREESISFINSIKNQVENTDVECIICAPFTLLETLLNETKGTNIQISAQNMHFKNDGAYTGEISPIMLTDLGIKNVLIGHSERRQYFNETDETVNLKITSALSHGIRPIVCVGELLAQREDNKEFDVVREQVKKAYENILDVDAKRTVIAYEPVWAIGTGKTASKEDANTMIAYIRSLLLEMYSEETSEEIRILYGGSVKVDNVEELMNMDDIDGALVGGASLDPLSYVNLVNF